MAGSDDDARRIPEAPAATPALRVSDADRERAAEALRTHAGDGRLTTDELEERLAAAYAARTSVDLADLTVDLPELATPERPSAALVADTDARQRLRALLVQRGGGAAAVSLLCVVIWLATGADGPFWPIWVVLGTGVGVGATWWRGLGPGGDPVAELARADEREERRRYHDPHRRRGGPHF